MLLSLVMTAKAIGIDPKAYLRDLLLRVTTESDVAKLTPRGWKEHFPAEVAERRQAVTAYFAGA